MCVACFGASSPFIPRIYHRVLDNWLASDERTARNGTEWDHRRRRGNAENNHAPPQSADWAAGSGKVHNNRHHPATQHHGRSIVFAGFADSGAAVLLFLLVYTLSICIVVVDLGIHMHMYDLNTQPLVGGLIAS